MPDAKRPPAVDLVADLPTPAVDDCPTPVLAAITGLNKLEVDRPLHELDLGIKTPHGKARKKTDAFVSPIAFGPFSPRRMRTQTTGSKHPKSLPPPSVMKCADEFVHRRSRARHAHVHCASILPRHYRSSQSSAAVAAR